MCPSRIKPRHRSNPRLDRAVAASVDAPVSLLPHLSDLFADLTALGSNPRLVSGILRARRIRPRSRVLDLACGKGAVTVALAGALGCECVGVDAFEPFIESARASAARRRVADLCEFIVGDVSRFRAPGRFDAALMLGLFAAPKAAKVLRPHVKRGGVYVIDDAPAMDEHAAPGLHTVDQTTRAIERLGDRVLRVIVFPPSRTRRLNESLFRRIERRARIVKRSIQSMATRQAIDGLLARQKAANRELATRLRPAIWVVEKR